VPKIAWYKFFTFFIVSFDTLNEPPHLHIAKGKSNRIYAAKIWLETLKFAETADMTKKELNLIQSIVRDNQKKLLALFAKAKAGKKIKPVELKLK
jgi:hypothetical protein